MDLKYNIEYQNYKPSLKELRQKIDKLESQITDFTQKYGILEAACKDRYLIEVFDKYNVSSGTPEERIKEKERFYKDEFGDDPFFSNDVEKMTEECLKLRNETIEAKNELIFYRWLTYPNISKEDFYSCQYE